MPQLSLLEKSILEVIVYFNIFKFPLTITEIQKYISNRTGDESSLNLTQILNTLQKKPLQSIISYSHGLYYLKNNEINVATRLHRYTLSFLKIKLANFIKNIFSALPFIQFIGICNSLGYKNASEKSDIDLFIITKPNYIWLTRLITLSFLSLFNLRPKQHNRTNKICLCFFINDQNLNIKHLTISNNDIYLIYWIQNLYPLLNRNDTYNKFIKANAWIKQRALNNVSDSIPSQTQLKLNWIEKLAKEFQMFILPSRLKSLANQNSDVVLSDNVLKFHDNDRRKYYYDLWNKNLQSTIDQLVAF